MAHEQQGQKWTNCTDDIPTTDPEVCLASLDISDPLHPTLRRLEAQKAKTEALKPRPVQADSSFSAPNMNSVNSDGAAHMSGRVFMSLSPRTSATDGSWTIDVGRAMMNVSGQVSFDENEHRYGRETDTDNLKVKSGRQTETVARETENTARDN